MDLRPLRLLPPQFLLRLRRAPCRAVGPRLQVSPRCLVGDHRGASGRDQLSQALKPELSGLVGDEQAGGLGATRGPRRTWFARRGPAWRCRNRRRSGGARKLFGRMSWAWLQDDPVLDGRRSPQSCAARFAVSMARSWTEHRSRVGPYQTIAKAGIALHGEGGRNRSSSRHTSPIGSGGRRPRLVDPSVRTEFRTAGASSFVSAPRIPRSRSSYILGSWTPAGQK